MTFTPNTNNKVSVLNSSSTPLGASNVYIGTSEDVSRYSSINLTITASHNSDALGIQFEFSYDNVNWNVTDSFTYVSEIAIFNKTVQIKNKYFRIRYTNGTDVQSFFRLQCLLTINNDKTVVANIQSDLIDLFGRLRVSTPFSIISYSNIIGKQPLLIYENITGSATSVHNENESSVTMSTTGTGSVIRRSRLRGIYQPGKSLLVFLTGVLNSGSNASTVTTKIGYYDNNNGYYFKYNNGIVSIVERSSVSGSLVESTINQSNWNVSKLNGIDTQYILNPSKALIFWFAFEWLGVGIVNVGVVIGGKIITTHSFRHSNLLTTAYIQTASLPPTYEIISTLGSGSMKQICFEVSSEGGFSQYGNVFSANMGETSKNTGTSVPLIAIKLSPTSIVQINILEMQGISITSVSSLFEIWKFSDVESSSVLTGASFVSPNSNSQALIDTSSTAIVTTNGVLLTSIYASESTNSFTASNKKNASITVSAGISDLIVLMVTQIGGSTDDFIGSVTWEEIV